MKVSDYIVDFLCQKGVKVVFGYQGGMVTHIVHSIHERDNIDFIQTYHEQSAAFAAVGYGRHTNNVGVAIATSGPGATNMITGIADAFFDSVPTLFITGQVNTHEYKYDKPIRQLGFQETNIVEMLKPITKYVKMVDKYEDVPYELEKCFHIATSGRKGPVLLDIPMNIQRQILAVFPQSKQEKEIVIDEVVLDEVTDLINQANQPLILIGGGVNNANALEEVRHFISRTGIPYVSSLLGKSSCNEYDEMYIGTIGSYGNRCANMAIANTDLLLVLGARLDVRQTGGLVNSFVLKGKIIHVDIDLNELKHSRINNKIKIHACIKKFISQILNKNFNLKDMSKWHNYLSGLKNKYHQANEIKRIKTKVAPYKLIEILNQIAKEKDIFCADVGQNQMWAMQMLRLRKDQRFYTSGGLGSMGSCLPIAAGVAFAQNNDNTIFSINGDGGIHMAVQSLMLIAQYDLPVKVIIINNHALGMITQFQELYFNNVTTGTTFSGGYQVPDFSGIAKAYKMKYFKVDATNEQNIDIKDFAGFIECRNCILEYVIDSDCRVYPKLEFDQPIYNPSPALHAEILARYMLVYLDI
ncbi:MAG: putative acetolactate synthase [Burkholderiales bacterium]|nr:putative acetolactate synthase [Burkholderiales bacterium]